MSFHSFIAELQRRLIRLMPGHCPLCQRPTLHASGYCAVCIHALPRNRPSCYCCALPLSSVEDGLCCARCLRRPRFHRATAPLLYTGDTPALVHAFKFHAALPAASLLAELMGKAFHPPQKAWLLTVPQHPHRARQRGFDHIDWLATLCPSTRRMPRITAHRRYDTPPLRHLDRRQRLKLMKDAFSIETDVTGKHIVLLDDVMTTGATLNALAILCRRQGARRVEALAIARTPPSTWRELHTTC